MAPDALNGDCLEIRPHPGPQSAFLACPADIAIYGGAAGGGKTWALLLEPLRHVQNRRFNGIVFRRTTPQIRGSLWPNSVEIYRHLGARSREGLFDHRFPSGAVLKMAHLEHPKHRFDHQGAEYDYIGFDELTLFTPEQFWYLALTRARSVHGIRPYVRATCNPDPDSFVAHLISWWWDPVTGYPIPERSGVIRWFLRIDDDLVWADEPDELRQRFPGHEPKSFTFIEAKLADNPTLDRGDPTYRSSLMAMTHVERERLLQGNWKIRESRVGLIWHAHRDTNAYHEDDPRWAPIASKVRSEAKCYGGWDYGSGPSRLVCLMGLLEWHSPPRLWVEWDLWWQQTAWQTAAADVREKLRLYPAGACHFGDPAGIQRESDQSSWEQNLRIGGVPLMRLHHTQPSRDGKRYQWQTREGIEWMIKHVQLWLDEGRLLIHRRCQYLWSCLESWSWNIPEGAEVDELSRAYIGPRKDVYSHGANALMYLVAGVASVIATTRRQEQEKARPLPSLRRSFQSDVMLHRGGRWWSP